MSNYKYRIKYEGKEWLVIDAFKFNDKKYMYLVSDIKEEINNEEDLEKYKDKINIIFIENVSKDNYITVEDEKLIDILSVELIKRKMIK